MKILFLIAAVGHFSHGGKAKKHQRSCFCNESASIAIL